MKRYLPFVIIAGVLIISTVTAMLMYRSAAPETPTANISTALPTPVYFGSRPRLKPLYVEP